MISALKTLSLVFTFVFCFSLSACGPSDAEKRANQTSAEAEAKAVNDARIQGEIFDILNRSKVHPSWTHTIGDMLTKVFYNYEIVWKSYNDSDTQYEVSISGDYQPTPNIKNLCLNGTITYLVDIELRECTVLEDPKQISDLFLAFIVSK